MTSPDLAPKPSEHAALASGIGLFTCIAAMVALYFRRELPFFRDYAIIFDGAARVVAGQWPFGDFGMPIGAVSVLTPALAMKLFGVSWGVFQATQLVLNSAILLSITLMMRQLGQGAAVTLSAQVLTTLLYLIFLTHPWYNTTALVLLLVSLNLALGAGALAALLSGAFAMACVFTKQDFGISAVASSGGVLFFRAVFDKAGRTTSLVRLAFFAAGITIALGGFLLLYPNGYLAYWFNFGQPPHQPRMPYFKADILYVTLALGVWLLCFAVMRRSLPLVTGSLLFLSAHLTTSLSGQPHTHYYSIAVLPLIIATLAREGLRQLHFAAGLAMVLMTLYLPVVNGSQLLFRIATGTEADRGRPVSQSPIIELGTCIPEFSRSWGPASVCNLYEVLRERIASGELPEGGLILNASELTPMTAALGYREPVGYPLWYDRDIVLFDHEIEMILADAAKRRFDIVLLQGVHGGLTEFHRRLLTALRADATYEEFTPPFESPSGMRNCRHGEGACLVYVFVRKLPQG